MDHLEHQEPLGIMEVLPLEIIGVIVDYVDPASLMDCVCVSKTLSNMCMKSIETIKSKEQFVQSCRKGKHLSLIRSPLFKLMIDVGIQETAKHGHNALCKLFLQNSPDWNKWQMALTMAAEGGNLELIRFLLNEYLYRHNLFECEPRLEDWTDGVYDTTLCNALNQACQNNQYQAVVFLLEYQPYLNVMSLQHACASGSHEIVDLILGKIHEPSVADYIRGLSGACIAREWSIAQRMIKLGANDWKSAITAASINGWTEMVLYLSDKDNIVWNDVLLLACRNGHYDLVKMISEKFGDKVYHWNTAFRISCSSGDLRIVQLINDKCLDEGLIIDPVNLYYGMVESFSHGGVDIVEYMWTKFARSKGLSLDNPDTWTEALIWCIRSDCDNLNVIRFILSKGGQITKSNLSRAIGVASYNTVCFMLDNYHLPLTDEILNNGVARARDSARYDVVHLLIERGASKSITEH